ncbi:hypothetical protein WYO_4756 [Methylobacterium sp. GXF4]|nr:hypothetical protein WYO_4756 [Methylobacterium sp. GXF4]
MYPRPVISNSTTCGKGADTWRTPMPAHIGAAPSLATRTKPPASRFPSARMRCAKAGAAVIRTNRFRASGGAHRPGTATAREAGPAHRFDGIACRDAAGVRMPAAQGRPGQKRRSGAWGRWRRDGCPGQPPRRPPGPVRPRDPSRSRGTQHAADASWRVRRRDGGTAAGRLAAAELGSQAGAYARRSRFGAEGARIQGAGASALCFDARAGIGQYRDRSGTAVAVAWRRICSARLSTTKKAQPRAGP